MIMRTPKMQKFNQEFINELADKKLATIASTFDERIRKLENTSNAKLATMVNLLVKHCQDLDERIQELKGK